VEVKEWNSDEAWIYAKIPAISSSADTTIYLYYDRDHDDNTDHVGVTGSAVAQNVWDSSYNVVYLMQNNGSNFLLDSTSNENSANINGATETSAGPLGTYLAFDGVDDNCVSTSNLPAMSAMTVEIYAGTGKGVTIAGMSSGDYIVGWYDGTNIKVGLNGAYYSTYAFSGTLSSKLVYLGSTASPSQYYDGSIYEYRISSTARSDAWIAATYAGFQDDLITFSDDDLDTLVIIKIADEYKTNYLKRRSLQINDTLATNSRSTAKFDLYVDDYSDYEPSIGSVVYIRYSDTTKIFGGLIQNIKTSMDDDQTGVRYTIDCVDFSSLCDRHLVEASIYTNENADTIIKDIVDNGNSIAATLSDDGISYDNVETGLVIDKAIFNYNTCTYAFNELAERCGYDWYIDYDKDIHFFERSSNAASFDVSGNNSTCFNISTNEVMNQYRNVQYMRGGNDTSDLIWDNMEADGVAKAFLLRYNCAAAPSIYIDDVAQTVGIRDVDEDKDVYWSSGSNSIAFETAPSNLSEISVNYQYFFPIFTQMRKDDEISSRSTAEGTSGEYEVIDVDSLINSVDLATSKSNALLSRFGTIPTTVSFDTYTHGLRAGQLINITIPALGLDTSYLIDTVRIRDDGGVQLKYSIKALSGESLGGWLKFFKDLHQSTKDMSIQADEVPMILRRFADDVLCGDTLTEEHGAISYVVGTAKVGYSEIHS
jgi:hypothetical protein